MGFYWVRMSSQGLNGHLTEFYRVFLGTHIDWFESIFSSGWLNPTLLRGPSFVLFLLLSFIFFFSFFFVAPPGRFPLIGSFDRLSLADFMTLRPVSVFILVESLFFFFFFFFLVSSVVMALSGKTRLSQVW